MSSIDEKHMAACKSKAVYLTIQVAREAADKALGRFGVHMKPYPCPACGLWHLTTGRSKIAQQHTHGERA